MLDRIQAAELDTGILRGKTPRDCQSFGVALGFQRLEALQEGGFISQGTITTSGTGTLIVGFGFDFVGYLDRVTNDGTIAVPGSVLFLEGPVINNGTLNVSLEVIQLSGDSFINTGSINLTGGLLFSGSN